MHSAHNKSKLKGFRRVLHHSSVSMPAVNFGRNIYFFFYKNTALLYHLCVFLFSIKRKKKLTEHTDPALANVDSISSSFTFQ